MVNRVENLCLNLSDEQAVIVTSKPNIMYYSGFTSEDAVLFISKKRRIIVTDSRYTVQAKQQTSGFELADIAEGMDKVFETVNAKEYFYEEKTLPVGRFETYKRYADNAKFSFGSTILAKPRMIKSSYEIGRIREAEKLGDAAFSHILDFIKTGMTEKEVALELEFFMRKNGAEGLSFDTIVASGIRSSMPHGLASDKIIEAGDFVTMDFGCILDGYCSDMTRTVIMSRCTAEQREIYNIVLNAQQSALDKISSGIKCSDIDKTAREIIAKAGYGKNFGHGLGHSVGLEIHELPSLSPNYIDVLVPNNIVTVEPGIYIEGFGGVRIEDLVLVTNSGYENLTSSPKELIII